MERVNFNLLKVLYSKDYMAKLNRYKYGNILEEIIWVVYHKQGCDEKYSESI